MKTEAAQSDGITCLAFTFDRTLDSKQILNMAQEVESAIATHTDLRLLIDLRKTERFEIGAFLSPRGFLASARSIGPVSRYAVVGAPSLAATAVEAFGTLLPLESRAFPSDSFAEAESWVWARLA
jgi:SpoIIAA-like